MKITQHQIIKIFNITLGKKYNTVLAGGFEEPYFQSAKNDLPAQIQFTHDYVSSALHEVSHWCIAGAVRLLKNDFGYWYIPGPRTAAQQLAFFDGEVKSQALEWIFHDTLGIKFHFSFDNLDGVVPNTDKFEIDVQSQKLRYQESGLPPRGREFNEELIRFASKA